MSIVVRGFGLDIDSFSSIVAWGLNRDAIDAVNPLPELEAATIDECFVIDFRAGRRKMSRTEWTQWRRVLAVIRRSRAKADSERRRNRELTLTFRRELRPQVRRVR